jgi:hypothetical protein
MTGVALDGYATGWNQQQHVNIITNDGHVQEFYYDGSRWRGNDLSDLAGASTALAGTQVLDG